MGVFTFPTMKNVLYSAIVLTRSIKDVYCRTVHEFAKEKLSRHFLYGTFYNTEDRKKRQLGDPRIRIKQ